MIINDRSVANLYLRRAILYLIEEMINLSTLCGVCTNEL